MDSELEIFNPSVGNFGDMQRETRPSITKTGLKAAKKAPGNRSQKEHKQARRVEVAIARKSVLLKAKEATEKARINEALKQLSKQCRKGDKGLTRLAYRVKLFWLIPNTKPRRFYPPGTEINNDIFDILKAATIALANQCIEDYEYGDRAIEILLILENPPYKAKRTNLAVSCRNFADLVLSNEN
jgi:hypothetical protein